MPETKVNGCRLSYAIEGPTGAPALVLSNALGTTLRLWDSQFERFAERYRVIRYDTRGHGASETPPGEYALDDLGRDVLGLLDANGIDRAHVCGVSLGGLIALWLTVHAPSRVGRAVLANTAARIGTREGWQERIDHVRSRGCADLAAAAPARWFTEPFRRAHPETAQWFAAMVAGCSPDGYAACCAALRDADLRPVLGQITAPVLVITGAADPSTPPSDGDFLCAHIPNAQRLALPCSHLSNVEEADTFTREVTRFLAS